MIASLLFIAKLWIQSVEMEVNPIEFFLFLIKIVGTAPNQLNQPTYLYYS